MRRFGTMTIQDGELVIGGMRATALAGEYGTPLYVMDEQHIRDMAQAHLTAFGGTALETGIVYAAKAFFCVAMARLAAELGLRLDVVSGGELYTALAAGYPSEHIYFHGNNKTDAELRQALDAAVGTVVIDNRSEADRLAAILRGSGRKQRVMLRINPGIEAHTHHYIKTAVSDSKFGESFNDPAIFNVLASIGACGELDLYGFHCHVGSQIFEESTFFQTAAEMIRFARAAERQTGMKISTLNLGGGFGVYYAEGDKPLAPAGFLGRYRDAVLTECRQAGLALAELLIEPGRALVANAGTTLYTVGDLKQTTGGPHYLFVDGGMTDNPRPALYQARYEACLANRADEAPEFTYAVAGKMCESGDILIRDCRLPAVRTGDLLAVGSTGAYNYSMSSNYNRTVRPAVVFVKDGRSRLAVRRQTYDDILAQDVR